jgi:hypothetical protein
MGKVHTIQAPARTSTVRAQWYIRYSLSFADFSPSHSADATDVAPPSSPFGQCGRLTKIPLGGILKELEIPHRLMHGDVNWQTHCRSQHQHHRPMSTLQWTA